jgi:outer membrane protein TolC
MFRFRYCFFALSATITFSSCYVNQAVLDPYAYAPLAPYTYYIPERTPQRSEKVCSPQLPDKEHPITLAEIIDIGLKNTPETRKSWSDARASAAAYAQSQSTAFPEINGILSYLRSYTPALVSSASGKTSAQNTYLTQIHPNFELTYTIFDFGQRRLSSEAARYSLYFSDWTHNRTIQTVVQTLTNAYYNYLFQIKLHQSIAANVATAKTTLKAALAEKDSGYKDISDVLQAKTLLLQTELNFSAQRQLVQEALSTLLKNMGVPADAEVKFQDLPENISTDIILKSVDELITNALFLRPDLHAAEANVKSKEAELQLSIRKFFPVLDYQLIWGRTYFQDWIRDKNDWTNVLSINLPIFSGFSKINAVREARAKKEKSEALLRQKELEITQDITDSHSQVVIASDTLRVARDFLSASSEQYNVALLKYQSGIATILDLVSAQDSLATARARLALAVQQWYTSLTNLTYATGYYSFNPKVGT